MGIMPLQFLSGQNADALELSGKERFSIALPESLSPRQQLTVKVSSPGRADASENPPESHLTAVELSQVFVFLFRVPPQTSKGTSFCVTALFDSEVDVIFFKHGGLLRYVARTVAKNCPRPDAAELQQPSSSCWVLSLRRTDSRRFWVSSVSGSTPSDFWHVRLFCFLTCSVSIFLSIKTQEETMTFSQRGDWAAFKRGLMCFIAGGLLIFSFHSFVANCCFDKLKWSTSLQPLFLPISGFCMIVFFRSRWSRNVLCEP